MATWCCCELACETSERCNGPDKARYAASVVASICDQTAFAPQAALCIAQCNLRDPKHAADLRLAAQLYAHTALYATLPLAVPEANLIRLVEVQDLLLARMPSLEAAQITHGDLYQRSDAVVTADRLSLSHASGLNPDVVLSRPQLGAVLTCRASDVPSCTAHAHEAELRMLALR